MERSDCEIKIIIQIGLKDFNEYRLEKSINWKISIVKNINQFSAEIETQDGLKGTIDYKDITWTKKQFDELLKPGDIIYTEKNWRK